MYCVGRKLKEEVCVGTEFQKFNICSKGSANIKETISIIFTAFFVFVLCNNTTQAFP